MSAFPSRPLERLAAAPKNAIVSVAFSPRRCYRRPPFDGEVELIGFASTGGRVVAALFAVSFMIAGAGCKSGDSAAVLDPGASGDGAEPPEGKVLQSELRAYCPPVNLREGTSFISVYAKGGDDDPTKLLYQSSLSAVTRKCSYSSGTTTLEVAVAGRVVPGPMAVDGPVKLPIRVAVTDAAGQPIYSNLGNYEVQISRANGAAQFIYTDAAVSIPTPAPGTVQAYAGFDEGPQKKKKATDEL
jgi:hypothetical protein